MKRIGIIGAMDSEVEALISAMDVKDVKELATLKFYDGTLEGVPCVVVKANVGKVNAAMTTQAMICEYDPRLIINTGVAGGIGENTKIGDLVIASSCVQHDFDTTAMDGESGNCIWNIGMKNIPCDESVAEKVDEIASETYNTHIGVVVTGDQFIADSAVCRELNALHEGLACEMEGGSIAHVCYLNQVPVAVLRTISDNANDDAVVDFPSFVEEASKKGQELLRKVIKEL